MNNKKQTTTVLFGILVSSLSNVYSMEYAVDIATHPVTLVCAATAVTALSIPCLVNRCSRPPRQENKIFGHYDMQGKRETMEDACTIIPQFNGNSRKAFYAIYDGHGGRQAADYAARRLSNIFLDNLSNTDVDNALRRAFLTTDEEFRKTKQNSGTTALAAYIDGNKLHCAWAGDSRLVLANKYGTVKFETQDHKPDRKDEQQRIETAGGFVTPDCTESVPRLGDILAVSRALGNKQLREHERGKGLTAEPDTATHKLEDGDMIIMACDGLWDIVSSKGAAQFVQYYKDKLETGARELANCAFMNGSTDNISILLIPFHEQTPTAADAAKS